MASPSEPKRQPHGYLVNCPGGYRAFVPAPLPPPLAWEQELTINFSSADRAVGRLAGEGRRLPNPHILMRPFVRKARWGLTMTRQESRAVLDTCRYELKVVELLSPSAAEETPVYGSCEEDAEAGEPLLQVSRGGSRGFPKEILPSALRHPLARRQITLVGPANRALHAHL